jgi:YcaO-like protein with predicted kinase domain
VPPEETVTRLRTVLDGRYDYRLLEEQVAEHLFWAALFLETDPDFRAMGKGVSAVRSRAGALAETAEWLGSLDPDQLPGYTAAHQDDVADPLPIEDLVAHVATATPAVLERIRCLDSAKHWADGYSLLSGRTLKVPVEYIRQIGGPNGRASGNRLEEAIVHATHEIFERRAHVTVLRNRMIVPSIDPDSIDHPVIRDQIDCLRARDIEITIKDLSFNGNLPCVGAYFADPHVSAAVQFHHFFKVGASFDRQEALLRVFTEYTQGRRADEFGSDVEIEKVDFRRLPTGPDDADNFLSAFMFGMVPYRNADFLREGETIPFDPGTRYEDCLEDIEEAKRIARALGKDYIVVDQTDPDFGFPVVQVVIPGYSDILPYHPATSPVLFEEWNREDAMQRLAS